HLSDLHPQYLGDKEVFHCPADASPGSPGVPWATADPQFPSSYVYEMSTDAAPFPSSWLGPPALGEKPTWRDNNRRERIAYGDLVPVIRCFHHGAFRLNVTPSG